MLSSSVASALSKQRRGRSFRARVRSYVKRRLDVAVLLSLAGLSLLFRGLKTLGLHPLSASTVRRLPSRRVRVVLFIPSLGMGGAQRQLVTLLKHLDRDRYDPEVVALGVPDRLFERRVQELSVPIVYLAIQPDTWMMDTVRQLVRHLYAKPCHVLHSWLHSAVAMGAIAGCLVGIPTIVGSFRSQRPSLFPWSYPKWQRILDLLTAPLSNSFIANSKAVRQDSRRWGLIPARKLHLVYNAIDISEASQKTKAENQQVRSVFQIPDDRPLIGIIGRLEPEKDHATFLRAAQLIGRAKPHARFVIAGDGRLREWLEAECGRLSLSDRVQLMGVRENVSALMQTLDVLVLTSTQEGFPNVLLEAAVAGVPMVTTAAGGAVEAVVNGETGFVVPCGDAEAVAQKVLRLLDEGGLREKMIKASRKRVSTYFSADRAVEQIQSIYETNGRVSLVTTGPPTRVCFISPNAYGLLWPSSGHPFGGAEVQIYTLAKELAGDPRFDMHVLTGGGDRVKRERDGHITIVLHALCGRQPLRDRSGTPEAELDEGTGAQGLWPMVVEHGTPWLSQRPAGVQTPLRGVIRGAYTCRRWLKSWSAFRWVVHRWRDGREIARWVRLLRSIGADIYVMRCASPQVGWVSLACRLLRRKWIFMVAHEYDVSGEYVRKHGEWGQWFEYGLRHAHAVVCQHSVQVDLFRSRYRQGATLIRSLCPFPGNPSTDGVRRNVLWVARADGWKQPDVFLELARRMPEASFVMVAPPSQVDPDILPRLRKEAEELPNLSLLPGVPLEDTTTLFEEAMVFVNTSHFEGFPNTFLQAAASGTPIVSWAVNPDGMLERYEMGYHVEQDWERFERCVRRLCADAALRDRMGDNGRRYIDTYHDPSSIAREYAQLFLTVRRHGEAAGLVPRDGGAPRIGSTRFLEHVQGTHIPLSKAALLAQQYDTIKREMVRRAVWRDDVRFLDIGCGLGMYAEYWHSRGAQVTGVDIDKDLIAQARARAVAEDLSIRYETATAERLPFEDQSFDVVFANSLLEHVVNWEQCLDEWIRVLGPGSLLWIETTNVLCPRQGEFRWLPLYSWWPGFMKKMIVRLANGTFPALANYSPCPAMHWFSYFQLKKFFDGRGLFVRDRFDSMDLSQVGMAKRVIRNLAVSRQGWRWLAYVLISPLVLLVVRPAGVRTRNECSERMSA